MKLGKILVADASIALLVIQLVIVSSIAAKYLYQRWTCPRVWTRTTAYDPEMPMRGRYVSVQLLVDGCRNTMPSAEQADTQRTNAALPAGQLQFPAQLKVEGDKLLAIRIPEAEAHSGEQMVTAWLKTTCANMRLDAPLDFFIGEHAANPQTIRPGQELWIEVSVPPHGPPRPIQLALKDRGAWKPLAYQ
jgi:hypothetical protein